MELRGIKEIDPRTVNKLTLLAAWDWLIAQAEKAEKYETALKEIAESTADSSCNQLALDYEVIAEKALYDNAVQANSEAKPLVKLTSTQAVLLEDLKASKSKREIVVDFVREEYSVTSPIYDMSLDTLIQALYIGYDISE